MIQDVLGHSQISITADTYSHVGAPLREEAARTMNGILGPTLPPSSVPVVVKGVVKPADAEASADENLQIYWENLVGPLGIEPRTNRLRVCCSTN